MARSTASSSLAAPPEWEDLVAGASVPDPATAMAIQSVLSDDPGTYLEDGTVTFFTAARDDFSSFGVR